jgi:EmrB/QacA subfamily drug resistance transporter/deazaflavin-dependent oxidoreductase (nitroreductase family)
MFTKSSSLPHQRVVDTTVAPRRRGADNRVGPPLETTHDAGPEAATEQPQSVWTREILTLAAVVVLGSIMTILDATIVIVALPTLGRDFHTSIATIQWVPTVYLLAFASVIPLTGWASQRFGAKPLWLAALLMFMGGSLLAGLSWSIGALIVFRIVQGLGGGMILPLGQMILAREAGPQRMGRVMSLIGVPLLLAPIVGPVVGGGLVDASSWRWIFFVNLPVGVLALLLAIRLLPSVPRGPAPKLDRRGLLLLSGGIATFIFGLAEVGQKGTLTATEPLTALAIGALLIAAFLAHALRAANPLLDVRLFANRGFASGAAANFVLGVALFGVALLLPLYFQIIRDRTPLETGLLMIPQGLGAAVAIGLAGSLTDKIGARRVVPVGVALATAGTLAYTQIAVDTPYWYLAGALFLIGAGLGATITPSMAAAFHDLDPRQMGMATSTINVVQRVAGSLGTALLAIVLQRSIQANLGGFHGGIGQAAARSAQDPSHAAPAIASAFGTTFWVAVGLTVAAFIPAMLLPRRRRARGEGHANGNRRFLKPSWGQRHIGNRLAPLFQRDLISKLSVRGRRSGRWRTTPVAVLEHGGERYLISYRGASDWALNLEASHSGRLAKRGRVEEITVEEVPVGRRAPLLEVYGERFGRMPTVGGVLRALPDPADHPTFRIISASPGVPDIRPPATPEALKSPKRSDRCGHGSVLA